MDKSKFTYIYNITIGPKVTLHLISTGFAVTFFIDAIFMPKCARCLAKYGSSTMSSSS